VYTLAKLLKLLLLLIVETEIKCTWLFYVKLIVQGEIIVQFHRSIVGMAMILLVDSNKMQLYKELTKQVDSMHTRMGVLGYVKWMVQVFHTPLIREILLLIEREADLMFRGRPASSLNGLRQRILNLFLQVNESFVYRARLIILMSNSI